MERKESTEEKQRETSMQEMEEVRCCKWVERLTFRQGESKKETKKRKGTRGIGVLGNFKYCQDIKYYRILGFTWIT